MNRTFNRALGDVRNVLGPLGSRPTALHPSIRYACARGSSARIVNLTRSNRLFWPLSLKSGQPPMACLLSRWAPGRLLEPLKGLDPGPKLDFQRPGAAWLPQYLDVSLRDRVGIKRAVGTVRRIRPARAAH